MSFLVAQKRTKSYWLNPDSIPLPDRTSSFLTEESPGHCLAIAVTLRTTSGRSFRPGESLGISQRETTIIFVKQTSAMISQSDNDCFQVTSSSAGESSPSFGSNQIEDDWEPLWWVTRAQLFELHSNLQGYHSAGAFPLCRCQDAVKLFDWHTTLVRCIVPSENLLEMWGPGLGKSFVATEMGKQQHKQVASSSS